MYIYDKYLPIFINHTNVDHKHIKYNPLTAGADYIRFSIFIR